ncbi:aminotransferase class I/II-fold pyridoxal phosphate-dependent enzyme [Candidatus Nucleicultrix amoebiphila]|jgi:histidinol-phosphate aminotransferase|uniref:aminotransferase class I/II-fold pyridoxal phosphate-dependent enzyme n=1 Tax=Candidatus Nucleicultrix amoebiphila TaxID=1509244 RepID=UPI000A26E69B|nr:aminotransferase class I/II-fold pyridoxal phosphate-dependent enzyme [Candidatus Nucleicultrix amoebiphila]
MPLHPQARKIYNELYLPGPVQKELNNIRFKIDLSNSTNPYGGQFTEYPDLIQLSMRELYIKSLTHINSKLYPDIPTNLKPEQILFTVGSIEGIDLLLRTFCEPGKDTICTLTPSFPAYAHWGKIHGLNVSQVPLEGENLDSFDIGAVVKTNPKMIFLCSPNNPTGSLLKMDLIKDLCRKISGFVVIDEAYIEFARQPSHMQFLEKYKNLIILRTFSKAWGMAGLRCGSILADPLIISTLRYTQIPFGISTPSQEQIKKRLFNPQKIMNSWDKIKKQRDSLSKKLSSLSIVGKVFKSDSNFLCVTLNSFPDTLKFLKDQGIYVADCSASLSSTVKISISKPDHHKALLHALSQRSYSK